MNYFVFHEDVASGPYDTSTLVSLIQSGTINGETQICSETSSNGNWISLKTRLPLVFALSKRENVIPTAASIVSVNLSVMDMAWLMIRWTIAMIPAAFIIGVLAIGAFMLLSILGIALSHAGN